MPAYEIKIIEVTRETSVVFSKKKGTVFEICNSVETLTISAPTIESAMELIKNKRIGTSSGTKDEERYTERLVVGINFQEIKLLFDYFDYSSDEERKE